MVNISNEDLLTKIATLRKAKKLHTEVENRLCYLIGQISTEYIPIKEPLGLAGGRNDLLLFEFSGKKVLFEIFASRGQVSRDLRILDKTKADKKIAVIIDRNIDNSVFDAFVKENPEDNYPYIFVSEIFEEPPQKIFLKLRQLVFDDETAKFQRMLLARIENAKLARMKIFNDWQAEGIMVYTKEDIQNKEVSLSQVFITKVLIHFIRLGISREKVKELGKWLSDNDLLEFIFMKMQIGFNVFLCTDFRDHFAIFSDIELSDWLRIAYKLPQAYSYLSLNMVMHEVDAARKNDEDKLLKGAKPSVFIGMSHVWEVEEGRIVDVSLPNNTEEIHLILPRDSLKMPEEYLKMVSIRDYRPRLTDKYVLRDDE